MFTTDLGNLYNRKIFKTSLYIYIFQDEKCRLMHNLSLSMFITRNRTFEFVAKTQFLFFIQTFPADFIRLHL